MRNLYIKWVKYNFILFFLVLISDCKLESNDDSKILEIVKRNLLRREKEYLKSQPLSENLKNFIRIYRRKADLLKLGKDKTMRKASHKKVRAADDPGSTTTQDNTTSTSTLTSTSTSTLQTTTTTQNSATSSVGSVSNSESSAGASTISVASSIGSDSDDNTTNACNDDSDNNDVTDEFEDLDVEETTTHKKELLGKVMKDVQELIKYENAAKTSEGEASLCNVTGDWDSFAGGMQIRIFGKFHPHNPLIKIIPQIPPLKGFLTESTWNATSIVPFKHSSLLVITAVSNKGKKIANFLGECRICEGSESITGHWMVRRRSKNCKDREEANSFISDVLRKNIVRQLRKEQLNNPSSSTVSDVDLSE